MTWGSKKDLSWSPQSESKDPSLCLVCSCFIQLKIHRTFEDWEERRGEIIYNQYYPALTVNMIPELPYNPKLWSILLILLGQHWTLNGVGCQTGQSLKMFNNWSETSRNRKFFPFTCSTRFFNYRSSFLIFTTSL